MKVVKGVLIYQTEERCLQTGKSSHNPSKAETTEKSPRFSVDCIFPASPEPTVSSSSWGHRGSGPIWPWRMVPSDRCRNVSSPTDWFLHIIFAPWFKACPCFVSVVGRIRGCQGKKPRLAGLSAATLTFSLVFCGRVLLASPLPASDWWIVPLLI